MLTGATTDMTLTRPLHAARFTSYNRTIRDALIAADTLGPDVTWKLFESIALFRRASTDADNIDEFVDLVLLLTAVDFLLLHPGTVVGALDFPRVVQLLAPFETVPCCGVRIKNMTVERSHIEAVMFALNAERNASLHPRDLPQIVGPYSFQTHQSPTFAWIIDRCYMALLIARLVELGALPLSIEVRAIVTGTEQWIYDPEHPLRRMILAEKVRIALREATGSGAAADALAAQRDDWERRFEIALGEVPGHIQIELSRLADQRRVIDVFGPGPPPERVCINSTIVDPVADDPVMMAYATHVWFENDLSEIEDVPMTPQQLEAMHNPRLWINGEVQRG